MLDNFFQWDIFCPFKNKIEARSYFGADYALPTNLSLLLSGFRSAAAHSRISQVHGNRVVVAEPNYRPPPEADAYITDQSRMLLLVLTADCLPIVLYEPTKNALAMIHAGRAGVENHIIANTITLLKRQFSIEPRMLLCGIGPAARGCCYQLPEQMARATAAAAGVTDTCLLPDGNGKLKMDLAAAVKEQLTQLTIDEKNIEITEHCTICSQLPFNSYRRGDKTSRNVTVAFLR